MQQAGKSGMAEEPGKKKKKQVFLGLSKPRGPELWEMSFCAGRSLLVMLPHGDNGGSVLENSSSMAGISGIKPAWLSHVGGEELGQRKGIFPLAHPTGSAVQVLLGVTNRGLLSHWQVAL